MRNTCWCVPPRWCAGDPRPARSPATGSRCPAELQLLRRVSTAPRAAAGANTHRHRKSDTQRPPPSKGISTNEDKLPGPTTRRASLWFLHEWAWLCFSVRLRSAGRLCKPQRLFLLRHLRSGLTGRMLPVQPSTKMSSFLSIIEPSRLQQQRKTSRAETHITTRCREGAALSVCFFLHAHKALWQTALLRTWRAESQLNWMCWSSNSKTLKAGFLCAALMLIYIHKYSVNGFNLSFFWLGFLQKVADCQHQTGCRIPYLTLSAPLRARAEALASHKLTFESFNWAFYQPKPRTSPYTPTPHLLFLLLLILLGEEGVNPPDLGEHATVRQAEAEAQEPQAKLQKRNQIKTFRCNLQEGNADIILKIDFDLTSSGKKIGFYLLK